MSTKKERRLPAMAGVLVALCAMFFAGGCATTRSIPEEERRTDVQEGTGKDERPPWVYKHMNHRHRRPMTREHQPVIPIKEVHNAS